MKTIVAFHTGRGGRFFNSGHVTFIGDKPISDFTEDLFLAYENQHDIFKYIEGKPNLEELYYKATDNYQRNESLELFEKKTGLEFGELIWTNCNGDPVGLTYKESESGVGSINIDNEYDTTNCFYLEDCGREDLILIARSDVWNKESLLRQYFESKGKVWKDMIAERPEDEFDIVIIDYFYDLAEQERKEDINRYSFDVKTEVLEIIDGFGLGSFVSLSLLHKSKDDKYIFAQFETSIGSYNHYYKIK